MGILTIPALLFGVYIQALLGFFGWQFLKVVVISTITPYVAVSLKCGAPLKGLKAPLMGLTQFYKLGVLLVGVLILEALLFGI